MGPFFIVRFYNITDMTLGSVKRQTWNSLLSSQDLELVSSEFFFFFLVILFLKYFSFFNFN